MVAIVKVIISFLMMLSLATGFVISVVGCAQKPKDTSNTISVVRNGKNSPLLIDASFYSKIHFADNSKSERPYLAMNVFYEPLIDVRTAIENIENVKLKHRGEAHITVITPPEYEKLKSVLSIELINEVALLNRIQESPFEIVCLGKGKAVENGASLSTYYLVIDSPKLLTLRHTIMALFKSRGGSSDDFNPDNFNPHITVGFTGRDLYDTDGVFKNKATCFIDVKLKAQ